MNIVRFSIVMALALIIASCSDPWAEHVKVNDNVSQETIIDYLESETDFSQFVALMKSVGMDQLLGNAGLYTVYAPTNSAMAKVENSMIDTDEKKRLFIQNHFLNGVYSALSDQEAKRLTMRSGKVLDYNPTSKTIDAVSIDAQREKIVSNGNVQVVESPLVPRYSIWDYIELVAPRNKFVSFLNSLTAMVFDPIHSVQVGIDNMNRPVYDTVWMKRNTFLETVTNLSSEDSSLTLLIVSDEVFDAEFNKFQSSFRVDDKFSNALPTKKDSLNIMLNIARDMVFDTKYTLNTVPDTLVSFYGVKVPFKKSAVVASFNASNGSVYLLNECPVKKSDKLLPIMMDAESTIYSISVTSGTPHAYYRVRDNASQGYDFILDNSHTSQILSGALFRGPVVASIKYRVKIRAINDFQKSYRNPSSTVVLRQMLGTVTITRSPLTGMITNISPVTNGLRSTTEYGVPDYTYDPMDATSYYVPFEKTAYSPLEQAVGDEVDLGFYEFSRADNVFLRLVPLSAGMAVTADYFRLVPIIE